MKVSILNDARNGHFGCELVIQTYLEQLDRVGIEVVEIIPKRNRKFTISPKIDLVIVNGEGSLHNGRRQELVNVANNYPAILLNTVWQDNPSTNLDKFKYVAVRESFSYKQLDNITNAEIIPDIIFTSSTLNKFKKPLPIKGIGITDNVMNKFQKQKHLGFSAAQPIQKYLLTMSKYSRLCIGRYHAAVAASVLNIPFSVWPSNTHKMIGMLTDMRVPHLHFNTQEEAIYGLPTFFDEKITLYTEQAQRKINTMFENIWTFQ